MKSSTKAVLIGAVIVVAVAIYFMAARDTAGTHQSAGLPSNSATDAAVPTADFLKSHPDALADAQKRCDAGTDPDVVALCDAVHGAKASLMSDKFRQGTSGDAK